MTKKRPRIAPRKPADAPESVAAQRFVEGRKPRTQRTPLGKIAYVLADGTELSRFTAYMPPDVKKRFDLWCLEHDTSGSDVMTSLVHKLLDGEVKLR